MTWLPPQNNSFWKIQTRDIPTSLRGSPHSLLDLEILLSKSAHARTLQSSPVKFLFNIKLTATIFFQCHLIVAWLLNSIQKIQQNPFSEIIGTKDFQLSPQETQFQENDKLNSAKDLIKLRYFLKNFRYNIANVFWVVLF